MEPDRGPWTNRRGYHRKWQMRCWETTALSRKSVHRQVNRPAVPSKAEVRSIGMVKYNHIDIKFSALEHFRKDYVSLCTDSKALNLSREDLFLLI
jgi:hypothetical protein